jgi:hypothetical protein
MNAWRMLLMPALVERRLVNETRSTYILLLLGFAAVAAGMLDAVPPGVSGSLGPGMGASALLIWWGLFLQNFVRQNRPTLACLVPHLRRRLMTLTVVLWLAASMANAVVFGLVIGHAGYVLLGTAALLWFVAIAQRHVWLAFAPSAVIIASLTWFAKPVGTAARAAMAYGEATVTVAGLLLLVPVGAFGLRTLYPRGGDRHFEWMRVATCRARNLKLGLAGVAEAGPWTGGLLRLFDRPYYRRLAAARPATPAAQGRLLLDGLGPRAYWTDVTATMALTAAVAIPWARWAPGPADFVGLFVCGFMLLSVLAFVGATLAAAKAGTGGQALLRLAPAAPAPACMNRALAAALLRRFGIVWAAYAASTGAIVAALPDNPQHWPGWLCFAAAAGALSIPLLRDYAHEWPASAQNVLFTWTLLGVPAAAMLLNTGWVPVTARLLAAAAIVLATVGVLCAKWRHMMEAPPALPAGRLA